VVLFGAGVSFSVPLFFSFRIAVCSSTAPFVVISWYPGFGVFLWFFQVGMGRFFICFSFPSRTVILLHRVCPFLPFISFRCLPYFYFRGYSCVGLLLLRGRGFLVFLSGLKGRGLFLFSSSVVLYHLLLSFVYRGRQCGEVGTWREDSFSLKGKGSVGGKAIQFEELRSKEGFIEIRSIFDG
jgi:hypothetical protein